MEKHFLEHYRVHDKEEAIRATKHKERKLDTEDIVKDRSERISAYLERLENIFLNENEKKRKRNIEMLKPVIYENVTIKKENFPEGYFDYQKKEAKRLGIGDVEFSKKDKDEEIEKVREAQRKSIEVWIDHLTSEDSYYPMDIKYFVMQGLLKTGAFDEVNYKFASRDEFTTASFRQIDHEALSMVMGALEAVHHKKDISSCPENLIDLIYRGKDFGSMYAEAMRFLDLESSKDKALEITDGKWLVFKQGSDPKELVKSFEGKRAFLCLGNIGDASGYLKRGDVHVYFSNNRAGNPVWPRVAIATEKSGVAYEMRGTYNKNEDIDTEIAKTGIIKDYLKTISSGETFLKKDNDMRYLSKLYQLSFKEDRKTEEKVYLNPNLLRDDLLFLYEVNSKIEGFGYNKDSRIEDIKNNRNRKEDIQTLCDCPPEFIATDFININENTQVFCEDIKNKIILFDFREEQNKKKLSQLIELAKSIKESGSPARPDMSFEGGILNIEIDNKTLESLSDWKSAKGAYEKADNNSPSWVWNEFDNIEYTKPTILSLDIVVLNHGDTTPQERDKLVDDMDKVGFRALDFSELVALGIIKPELNKRSEYLTIYKKYSLGGYSQSPCFYLSVDGNRRLDANGVSNEWSGRFRFLFVCK